MPRVAGAIEQLASNRSFLNAVSLGTQPRAEFLGVSNETPVDEQEELVFHMPGCFRSENENSPATEAVLTP